MLSQIEPIVGVLEFSRKRFTYGLTCVPAEQLNQSMGGSTSTPRQIAGKMAGFLAFIGTAIQNREMGAPNRGPVESEPQTTEELIAAVNAAFKIASDALASLTEEDLAKTMPAPWGEVMTLATWAVVLPNIAGYWQGQLNMAQLAYGDENPNIAPADFTGLD